MFTGIVETTVKLLENSESKDIVTLRLSRPKDWNLTNGQSIAHNGVCLTVTEFTENDYTVELMPETLAKSTFGHNMPKALNVEHAMAANGLLEGHIVQGHVDGVGTVIDVLDEEKWRTLKISYPDENENLLVPKGSITIDGVSLTVVDVTPKWFSVSLIPHTLKITTLSELKKDSKVNLEFDIIGKYVAKMKK